MLIKQSITSHKLGSQHFWQIANSALNKGKSTIPPLLNSPEVLSSSSHKAKIVYICTNLSTSSNLDDSGISLPVFPSRTNLKLHNISVTPTVVKKDYNKPWFIKGVWYSVVVPVFNNVEERSTAKKYCPVSLLSVVLLVSFLLLVTSLKSL